MAGPRKVKSSKNANATLNGALVADISDIQFDDVVDGQEYASSSTGGFKYEIAGHRKRSGSFKCLADQLPSGILNGGIYSLVITSDGTTEVFNGSYCLVKTFNQPINIRGGIVIEATVQWAEAENPA